MGQKTSCRATDPQMPLLQRSLMNDDRTKKTPPARADGAKSREETPKGGHHIPDIGNMVSDADRFTDPRIRLSERPKRLSGVAGEDGGEFHALAQ